MRYYMNRNKLKKRIQFRTDQIALHMRILLKIIFINYLLIEYKYNGRIQHVSQKELTLRTYNPFSNSRSCYQ